MMAMTAATAMAGQHTYKWDGNNLSKTMISLTKKRMTTINKKYDKGGWIRRCSTRTT